MQLPLTTLLRKEPLPEGKPWNKADNFCLIVRKHDEARGSREAADNFCLIVRKHDEARGRRVAADNFANFFARKMSKDKA